MTIFPVLRSLPVIAVAGYAQSGKTTCARYLVGKGFTEYNFATALKDILARVYHIPLPDWSDSQVKVTPHPHLNGLTPRRVLQLIGTEGFRNLIDQDTWVNCLARDVMYDCGGGTLGIDGPTKVVIGDLRFKSELAFLRAHGASVLYVSSNRVVGDKSHQSEAELEFIREDADMLVHNDGTLQELFSCLDKLYEGWQVFAPEAAARPSQGSLL